MRSMPWSIRASGGAEMAELSAASDLKESVIRSDRRGSFWRRLLLAPNGAIGAGVLVLLAISALLADVIAPYSPIKMGVGPRFLPPTLAYPLGTDEFGRDML